MKRFLLPLLLLLLTACSPQSLSGQVTEVITGPDGTLTALVIETDAHEERGLLITGETMLFSHLDGVSQDLLLAYELPELIVSAECERLNKTLVDGREMPACTVPWVSIDQVHLEEYPPGRRHAGGALADALLHQLPPPQRPGAAFGPEVLRAGKRSCRWCGGLCGLA
ncbi:MAG: hypothetical protein V8R75_13435 [Oscillospiraceae bacterium]